MKRLMLIITALVAGLAVFAAACGGGDEEKATGTAAATKTAAAASPDHVAGSPASREELETAFETARGSLQELITKAQAADSKGAKDAYEPADDPLHMIEDALASVDSSLADSIETKQHDEIEGQLDSGSPDLAVVARAAQDILPLLDQAASKLNIATSAQLATYLTTIKTVMQDTIAKAQAGDVQGTRDAEGKGDDAVEAIIKAVRLVDPSLADTIENLELDYEGQADSDNPDLAVIAKDAQDVLSLLDQAAAKLSIP